MSRLNDPGADTRDPLSEMRRRPLASTRSQVLAVLTPLRAFIELERPIRSKRFTALRKSPAWGRRQPSWGELQFSLKPGYGITRSSATSVPVRCALLLRENICEDVVEDEYDTTVVECLYRDRLRITHVNFAARCINREQASVQRLQLNSSSGYLVD